MLLMQIGIIFAVLLVICFLVITFKQNLPAPTDNFKLDRKDYVLITVITLGFTILSLIHFVTFDRYDNAWHGKHYNDQINLTFNKPTVIGTLYYAMGFAQGNYQLLISAQESNISYQNKGATLGYIPCFRYSKITFNKQAHIKQISFKITNPPVDFSKFIVLDANNHLLTDYKITSTPKTNYNLQGTKFREAYEDNWQSGSVFDEIYYVTSAKQYLQGKSPEVWVHPQLGIYLILIGIVIFGASPFGWRIMPNIAGIILIPLIYLFAKRIFKNRQIATIATTMLAFEFMHFTIGRVATLETFVTLFITLTYYFLYKYWSLRCQKTPLRQLLTALFWAGVAFGLAISSKWNAMFLVITIVILALDAEIIHNRPNTQQFILRVITLTGLLGILPLAIYLISFTPFAIINHYHNFIGELYHLHLAILDFNLNGLRGATHPYASSWWSWPLDMVPLSVAYWQNGDISSSVAYIGHPLLYWGFFVVIPWLGYRAIKCKEPLSRFLLLAILVEYLPYMLIQRISFIYYFYSVTPFLILGTCAIFKNLLSQAKLRYHRIVYTYLLIYISLFIIFFPALSGIEVDRSYTAKLLLWLPTWNF